MITNNYAIDNHRKVYLSCQSWPHHEPGCTLYFIQALYRGTQAEHRQKVNKLNSEQAKVRFFKDFILSPNCR